MRLLQTPKFFARTVVAAAVVFPMNSFTCERNNEMLVKPTNPATSHLWSSHRPRSMLYVLLLVDQIGLALVHP